MDNKITINSINPLNLEKINIISEEMINDNLLISYKNKNIPQISGVYFIFDENNELVYIGQSNNVRNRISNHLGNSYLSQYINNKYKVSVIEFKKNYEKLFFEIFYIHYFDTKYNNTNFQKSRKYKPNKIIMTKDEIELQINKVIDIINKK